MSFYRNMFPVISFLAALRLLTEAHSCNNGAGVYMYEKIPDYMLSESFVGDNTKVEVITKSGVGGEIARHCAQLCLKTEECFSFGFLPGMRRSSPYAANDVSWNHDINQLPSLTADYDESVCYIYQNRSSPPGTEILVPKEMSWHFNKVCLTATKLSPSAANTLLFAFLRVPGYRFEGENDKEVFASNISECENKCLEGEMCRSATYDMAGQRCRLSAQTRSINPKNYHPDGNSEYLENMCLTFRERCPTVAYVLEADKSVEKVYEAALLSAWDTDQCSKHCEQAQDFRCHGFHVNEGARTCVLYDEDVSGYNEVPRPLVASSGSLYRVVCDTYERDGLINNSTFECFRRKRLDAAHQVEVKANSFQECLDECVKRLGHACHAVTYSSGYMSCRFSTDQDKPRDGRPNLVDDKYYDYYEFKWLRGGENQGNHFGSRADVPPPGVSHRPGYGGGYRPPYGGPHHGPGYGGPPGAAYGGPPGAAYGGPHGAAYGGPHGGGFGVHHGAGYGGSHSPGFGHHGGSFGRHHGAAYGGSSYRGPAPHGPPHGFGGHSPPYGSHQGHHGTGYVGRPGVYDRPWSRPYPPGPGHEFRPNPGHHPYPPLPPRGPPPGNGLPFMPGGPDLCKPGMSGGGFRRVGLGQRMRSFYVRRVVRAERIEECEKICMEEKDFACTAFNFRAAFPDNCELTDQDSRQLQINNPSHFEKDTQFDYYERDGFGPGGGNGCMDVSQTCSMDGMEFSLKTMEPFFGRIYTYGFYDSCFFDGNGGTVNVLRISRANGFPRCGTQQYGDAMTNIVVVQFNDYVQTSRDKKYNLTCYLSGPGEAVVTSNYLDARTDGRRFPTQIEHLPAQNILTSSVVLRILYRGTPTNTIAVGDLLTFRVEARGHFQYEYFTDIFATNVIAKDPYSGRQVHLIDAKGCPVDLYVFPELHRTPDGALEAEFYAFKIPDSNLLVFQATVKTCRGPCEPIICNDRERPGSFPSWGRKKRNAADEYTAQISSHVPTKSGNETDEEENVHELLNVYLSRTDIPPDSPKTSKITKSTICVAQNGYYTLMAIVIVLVCVVLALSFAAVMFVRKYRLAKKQVGASGTSPNRGLSNLYISQYPSSARIEDPSEPIYTDPALFETARNVRSTTMAQFGRAKDDLD